MLNLQDHYGFLTSALMIFLEAAITSFSLTGVDIVNFYLLLLISLNGILITVPRRQRGRSYLGVLDCDSGSFSLLDIPFSDLSNVVRGKIFALQAQV
jgi:hypothetical protein